MGLMGWASLIKEGLELLEVPLVRQGLVVVGKVLFLAKIGDYIDEPRLLGEPL